MKRIVYLIADSAATTVARYLQSAKASLSDTCESGRSGRTYNTSTMICVADSALYISGCKVRRNALPGACPVVSVFLCKSIDVF